MIKIEIELFEYDELEPDAQEVARQWYAEGVFDYEWWESIYEDAAGVGIKINSFDIDRSSKISGDFTDSATHTADLIIKNHGETCGTYKLAKIFIQKRNTLVQIAPRDEDGEFLDESALDNDLDELETKFEKDILECYLSMLNQEADYMQSKECLEESIKANEYTFTKDGNRMDY
jgi:hypothetical protein